MAWENAVVTNGGLALLRGAMEGKALRLTRVEGGAGTVDAMALMLLTELSDKRQDLKLAGMDTKDDARRIKIQVTSDGLDAGYTMRQVGVYAKLDGDEQDELFFVMQDDTGVSVPSQSEAAEFLLEIYALLAIDTELEMRVTVDSAAVVSLWMLDERLNAVAESSVKVLTAQITLPADEWRRDEQQRWAVFPVCCTVAVEGCTAEHFPHVALTPDTMDAAKAAGVCQTVETLDGMLRFWAKETPRQDLRANAILITPGGALSGTENYAGTVLPIATKTTPGVVIVGQGLDVTADGVLSTNGESAGANVASDEEAQEMIQEIFGESAQENIATDEEVNEMFNEVFGKGQDAALT